MEISFLGIAEFWNGHKIACYDRDLLWKCLYDEGLPPDVVEEKLNNFYSFWEEIQKSDHVFKGKEEEYIKFHLPLLITRIKEGISPLLNNIVWKSEEEDIEELDTSWISNFENLENELSDLFKALDIDKSKYLNSHLGKSTIQKDYSLFDNESE